MPDQQEQQPSSQVSNPTFKRENDFESLYANSVLAESSVWDLKVIFGILDQSMTPNQVIQHTSVNLPWTQVKLLIYFAQIHLAIHEFLNGKVSIPQSVRPPAPGSIALPDTFPTTPALMETLKKLYDEFISTA
jgi:hypothetical protein